MSVIEGGVSGSLAGVGAESGSPLHVTSKPVSYGALGCYRLAATSGVIAAGLGAGAQLFYMKWPDATRVAVIQRVKLSFQTLALFTAGTLDDFGFDMLKVTGASAGGGGIAIAGSAVSKLRASMSASLFGASDIRIATTAALTALATLDANAIAASIGDPQRANPASGTEEQRVNDPTLVFEPRVGDGEHPLVLSQNEGFVLRNRAVWPAAGTGLVQVEVSWAEVTAY